MSKKPSSTPLPVGDKKLRDLVNCSGYPFQEAVAHLIDSDSGYHDWKLLGKELPWELAGTGESGYTDALAERNHLCLVVECKRRNDDDLVFLVPPNSKPSKLCIFMQTPGNHVAPRLSWRQTILHDGVRFHRSLFCGSRGQSKDSQSNFEPHARALLNACQSWATKRFNADRPARTCYVPTIVVNSKIYVCRYDPAEVSLENGNLPGSATLEAVPAAYFHKSFRTAMESAIVPPTGTQYPEDELSRTVLVVSAPKLREVLAHLVET